MPRYLTPSRICLLTLIDLYLSGHTAFSSRLSVLAFVAQHIVTPQAQDDSTGEEPANLAERDVLAFCEQLTQWPSDTPGRSVHDLFVQQLWTLNGLDSLHLLFDRLKNLLAPATPGPESMKRRISRASPIGQFVRRCSVEFVRLQFSDMQALWHAVAAYRAPTHKQWSQRNPEAARRAADNTTSSLGSYSLDEFGSANIDQTRAYASSEDVENLVTLSISQLQKLGTRMPDEVKGKLREWVTDQADSGIQSLQYFLAFFEHWRAGQYTMALESLHRYFDHSLVTKNGTDNMRVYYQYALLHLSVLHADFDCWQESVDAMDECIATGELGIFAPPPGHSADYVAARENQDSTCLNFALSWLLYLRRASPTNIATSFGAVGGLVGGGGGELDEIAFLKAKARETKNWSLLSSTLLEEAKLEMYSVGRVLIDRSA